jgi:hypothetical protein
MRESMANKNKRRSNAARKEYRKKLYTEGEERKAQRRAIQEAAHTTNKTTPGLTPWQQAKALRAMLRRTNTLH